MSEAAAGTVPARRGWAVGDTFTLERTCGRYTPHHYAAVSGDFNAIHLDAEAARAAGLPGNILHGMCTFAWLAEACVAYLGHPARLTAISARFARPVAPGDTVRFVGRCVAAEAGRVRLEIAAVNGRGEEVLKNALAEGRLSVGDEGVTEGEEAP